MNSTSQGILLKHLYKFFKNTYSGGEYVAFQPYSALS